MSNVTKLIGKQIYVQISGKDSFNGILTDVGKDIIVLFNGERYFYIPLVSTHRIQLNIDKDEQVTQPSESSFATQLEALSYHGVLNNAKGMYTEIYVTGNVSYHGYITGVNNDYFTFYSPVYKLMYISIHHLKWLATYNQNNTPYTLSKENLPALPMVIPLQKSLEEQLKQVAGSLVVFDGGIDPMKIGLLKKVDKNLIELAIASGETIILNLSHVKSVHMA